VDESPERIGRDHAQEPEDKQDYKNCPKHHCSIQSHKKLMSAALVMQLEFVLVIFQMTHTSRPETLRLCT
jgi:hypothetical protein